MKVSQPMTRRGPSLIASGSLILVLLVILIILILITGTPTRALAQASTPAPSPTPSNEQLAAQMEQLLSVADRSINTASTVAGFIQAISGIFAGIAGIGGLILSVGVFSTLRGYRTQLDQMRDQLNIEAQAAEQRRKTVEAQIEEQLQLLRNQAMEAIRQARLATDKTGRALTLIQLGEGQFETGNVRAAIKTYEEAQQLDPENRAANYQLGELHLLQGNLTESVRYLELALKADPSFAPAVAALGFAWRKEGDRQTDPSEKNRIYAQAEQKLLEALKLDPNVRDANRQSVYGLLAALYKRQGRVQDAIHYYTEAERVTPESSYPIGNLAQLYFIQGNLEKAHQYFGRSMSNSQHVLLTRPGDFWARFDIATAAVALDDANWERELHAALAQAPTGALGSLQAGLEMLRDAPHPPAAVQDALRLVHAEMDERHKAEQAPGA